MVQRLRLLQSGDGAFGLRDKQRCLGRAARMVCFSTNDCSLLVWRNPDIATIAPDSELSLCGFHFCDFHLAPDFVNPGLSASEANGRGG